MNLFAIEFGITLTGKTGERKDASASLSSHPCRGDHPWQLPRRHLLLLRLLHGSKHPLHLLPGGPREERWEQGATLLHVPQPETDSREDGASRSKAGGGQSKKDRSESPPLTSGAPKHGGPGRVWWGLSDRPCRLHEVNS